MGPARDPAELVPTIDPVLRAVILRCLERSKQDRFQRASDIAEALLRVSVSDEPLRCPDGWLRGSAQALAPGPAVTLASRR